MCNSKSFYDPAGIYGGGGDQLHAALGLGVDPKVPDVVRSDPKADAEKAAAEATAAANAKAAADKKRRANSSLLATGAQGLTSTAATRSAISYGKPTLGS